MKSRAFLKDELLTHCKASEEQADACGRVKEHLISAEADLGSHTTGLNAVH